MKYIKNYKYLSLYTTPHKYKQKLYVSKKSHHGIEIDYSNFINLFLDCSFFINEQVKNR